MYIPIYTCFTKMTELKREYVIPLRRKSRTAPKWRRSKKAVSVLKDFVKKHMKTDIVVIGNELNELIWENGIRNPPGKVSVVTLKKEFNGVEKTLVNLATVGIDSLLKDTEVTVPQVAEPSVEEELKTKEAKADVKEAEVKEVKKEESKDSEKKEAKEE